MKPGHLAPLMFMRLADFGPETGNDVINDWYAEERKRAPDQAARAAAMFSRVPRVVWIAQGIPFTGRSDVREGEQTARCTRKQDAQGRNRNRSVARLVRRRRQTAKSYRCGVSAGVDADRREARGNGNPGLGERRFPLEEVDDRRQGRRDPHHSADTLRRLAALQSPAQERVCVRRGEEQVRGACRSRAAPRHVRIISGRRHPARLDSWFAADVLAVGRGRGSASRRYRANHGTSPERSGRRLPPTLHRCAAPVSTPRSRRSS